MQLYGEGFWRHLRLEELRIPGPGLDLVFRRVAPAIEHGL